MKKLKYDSRDPWHYVPMSFILGALAFVLMCCGLALISWLLRL
jgi:hypothetical protein